ncbi:MAG: hypothetical protein HN580_06280 [Deltaproteobacteria bacterium]|nr:hypothetical protein [Deltaproteobacteria bacterium]MBT7888607.1 hypothetical protein [Deltaproteobacteria bacterium]
MGDGGQPMRKGGFILPFSIILALVILTSLGLWYRQVILQSFLADRLLLQRSLYIECRSLIPALRKKLNGLDLQKLAQQEDGFLTVEIDHHPRWRIDRSPWTDERIQLTFSRIGRSEEPLTLVIPYQRK